MKNTNDSGVPPKETPPSCARLKGEGEAPSGIDFPTLLGQWRQRLEQYESFQTINRDNNNLYDSNRYEGISTGTRWCIEDLEKAIPSSVSPNVAGASEEEKETPNGGSASHVHSIESEQTGDTRRVNYLQELFRNCPHAQITFCDDPDCEEGAIGFLIRVEGCETSESCGPTLRDAIDKDIRTYSVQGSEVHASQGPTATPIPKSPSSGPTDNDSKEEEWVVVVVRNEGQFAYYNLNGCHFYDSDISEKLKIVANAHNAALSALRARLQKQEEATQYFAERLQSKHPRTGAWDSQCPLCGEATEVGDIIHDADCPFTLATLILSALSQTPSLVHSET